MSELELKLSMAEKILHNIQESVSKSSDTSDPNVMYVWGQVDAYFSMFGSNQPTPDLESNDGKD